MGVTVPAISANNPRHIPQLCLRGVWGLLVAWLVTSGWSSQVLAGCHYSDGRTFATQHSDNPRDHARNFKFLGQWVYEKGEIKYVAWRPEQPCHGPYCKTHKPVPVTTVAPSTSVQRLPTFLLVVIQPTVYCFDSQSDRWLSHDCEPLSGYAQELEHPPKALFVA